MRSRVRCRLARSENLARRQLPGPMHFNSLGCADSMCEKKVARVSTNGQTLDAQIAQLKTAGAEKVFQEKVSGARIDRPQLVRLLRALEPGDRVLVTRLDRLARSTRPSLSKRPASGR